MLKVPQQQYIKFLYENGDCSISEIAKSLGINWRTAKKYAIKDDWNEPLRKRRKRYPILGPYPDIIDTWLTEEQSLPRKQRQPSESLTGCVRSTGSRAAVGPSSGTWPSVARSSNSSVPNSTSGWSTRVARHRWTLGRPTWDKLGSLWSGKCW